MQSLASLNILHLRNQAIFNKRYFADNGRVYIGTIDGKLKLEDKAVETSFSPTIAIPETNVQDAIENLSNGSNIGLLLTDTATIDFTYNPVVPASITADLKNTSVTAGLYGSATQSPQITIDAQGRITNATNLAVASSTLANVLIAGNTTGTNDIVINTGQKIVGQTDLLLSDSSLNNFYYASSSYIFQQWYDGLGSGNTDFLLQGGGTQLFSHSSINIQCDTGLYGFYEGTTFTGTLDFTNLLGNKNYAFPDNSGTIALLSDLTGGTVTSVSGTLNRITSTGGATPVIDISASYIGQTSITTLGTISSGTWNGGVISPVYGGTGIANNVASTLTISGAFASTLTVTGVTGVTLPLSGTLYGTLANSITSAQLLSSVTDETGTGVLVFGTAPTFTTNITTPSLIGGSSATQVITYKTTTGVAISGADQVWTTGNNGGIVAGRISYLGRWAIGNDASQSNYPAMQLAVLSSGINIKQAIYMLDSNTATAPTTVITSNYLQLGGNEFGTNSYRLIQFGYNNLFTSNSPAYIGYQEIANTSNTKGDLIFGTRNVETNTQATERLRITAIGNAQFSSLVYIGSSSTVPTAVVHIKAGTATASTGPLKFSLPGVVLTTREVGVMETDAETLYYTPTSTARQAIGGTLFTQTADKTVTNTVTETSIIGTGVGSLATAMTLPANFFNKIGKTLRLRIGGIYTTPLAAVPTLIIKVKFGATTIATVTTTSLLSGATNLEFDGEILITCRTVGATGTVMVHGDIEYATGVTGTISVDSLNNAGATTTIDTTSAPLLDITVQWDAATTTRIAKSTITTLEVLN